jgi:hypothetical protein
MATTVAESAYEISGDPVSGWTTMIMRAAMRNLPWRNIATELVDNALANKKPKVPSEVFLEWSTRGKKSFKCGDNGVGNTQPEVFLRPGLSGGNLDNYGNSTFGTGLFACEAHLRGRMQVFTESDDNVIRFVQRWIDKDTTGHGEQYAATPEGRAEAGLAGAGGTTIGFTNYKKKGPGQKDLDRIIAHLARCYASVLECCALEITVVLNGKRHKVKPESRPEVEVLHSSTLDIDGHTFSVEWGVTLKPTADMGCRLIYGGKLFDTTSEPCGDYNVGRFYAQLRIPQTAGQDSMDLLKRSVEKEFMDDLYEQCAELFEPQLQESHALCSNEHDAKLNDTISRMLSRPKGKGGGDNPTRGGNEDRREHDGREPDSEGIKPRDTGRKRKGRKKSHTPDALLTEWAELGEDGYLARYEKNGNKLYYNADNALLARWREKGESVPLAQVAAAHVAEALARSDGKQQLLFGVEGSFDDIYKLFMERIAQAAY